MVKQNQNLLFVGGDLSGIQKFIYNISSKKASVSLKGRSAFIAKYSELLYNELKTLPEVSRGDVYDVYCSSGKFYMIVDDTPDIRHSIDKFYERKESELWKEQFGQLGLVISYIPFISISDGKKVQVNSCNDNIGVLWKLLTESFAQKKAQKFKNTILHSYKEFFNVQSSGGNVKVCAITGIESDTCVAVDEEDSLYVLPSVLEHIKLGQSIRNIENFKTFEDYANDEYLAILRMDVDGLGARFIQGFSSFDDYKEFSKRLIVFFDTQVREIYKNYRDAVTIVYTGGDDLFAVGNWNKIIDFAYAVQKEFAVSVKSEHLTISAGIAVVGKNFPIAKAAQMAGEAEDKAKGFQLNGNLLKNAINLFGENISWSEEFDYVLNLKKQFVEHILHRNMSRSILHKTMLLSRKMKEGNCGYIWHWAYFIKRFTDSNNDEVIKNFCFGLQKVVLNQRQFLLLAIAARWAELEIRFSNKTK